LCVRVTRPPGAGIGMCALLPSMTGPTGPAEM
jgi:hypothetical protein